MRRGARSWLGVGCNPGRAREQLRPSRGAAERARGVQGARSKGHGALEARHTRRVGCRRWAPLGFAAEGNCGVERYRSRAAAAATEKAWAALARWLGRHSGSSNGGGGDCSGVLMIEARGGRRGGT